LGSKMILAIALQLPQNYPKMTPKLPQNIYGV